MKVLVTELIWPQGIEALENNRVGVLCSTCSRTSRRGPTARCGSV